MNKPGAPRWLVTQRLNFCSEFFMSILYAQGDCKEYKYIHIDGISITNEPINFHDRPVKQIQAKQIQFAFF